MRPTLEKMVRLALATREKRGRETAIPYCRGMLRLIHEIDPSAVTYFSDRLRGFLFIHHRRWPARFSNSLPAQGATEHR